MSEKLHRDYGLTDEDWNEIVDFYWQMFMMVHDAERRIEQRHRLVRFLYGHAQRQIKDRKKLLRDELSELELLAEKF
jgi:hypothetical protein